MVFNKIKSFKDALPEIDLAGLTRPVREHQVLDFEATFKLHTIRKGSFPIVVVINGFLSGKVATSAAAIDRAMNRFGWRPPACVLSTKPLA